MIHGAAGAVGSIAVQLAKAKGARVIGTGRSKVRSLVLDLGADGFVDIEHDGWEDNVEEIDVVFDTIGGEVLAQSSHREARRRARLGRLTATRRSRRHPHDLLRSPPERRPARRDRPARRRRHASTAGRCRLSARPSAGGIHREVVGRHPGPSRPPALMPLRRRAGDQDRAVGCKVDRIRPPEFTEAARFRPPNGWVVCAVVSGERFGGIRRGDAAAIATRCSQPRSRWPCSHRRP